MKTRWLILITIIAIPTGTYASASATAPSYAQQRKAYWTRIARDLEKTLPQTRGSFRNRLDQALIKTGKRERTSLSRYDPSEIGPVSLGMHGYIVNLEKAVENSDFPTATFYFSESKGRWQCSLVTFQKGFARRILNTNVARMCHGYLLLGGYLYEGSNFCNGGVQAFQRVASGWKLIGEKITDRECVRGAAPKGPANAITLITRDYPKNFVTPHSGPQATWAETYGVVKGKLRHFGSHRRNTAVNALDDLIGYVLAKKKQSVRRLCASDKLARQMMSFAERFKDDSLLASSDQKATVDEKTEIELIPAQLWLRFAKRKGQWILVELKETS